MVVLTACLMASACGSQTEDRGASSPSAGAEGGVERPAQETQSDTEAEDIGALFRIAEEAGLECQEVQETTADTHEVRVCDSEVLVAYFTDTEPLEGYVKGYLDKGQDVITGDSWFIAGRPERIEQLSPAFTG